MSKNGQNRFCDTDALLKLIDELPTAVFIKDENQRYVYVNRECEIQMGRSEASIIGKTVHEIFGAEEAEKYATVDHDVLETGVTSIEEAYSLAANGSKSYFLLRKSRIELGSGTRYLIGSNNDVTAHKRRDEQHRALVDNVPVGIMQIAENGTVRFANNLALEYLGLAIQPDKTSDMRSLLGSQFSSFPGSTHPFEMNVTQDAGPCRQLLVRSTGWQSQAGGRDRIAMVSFVDLSEMTELRRINDEISRLNSELADNMERLRDVQGELVQKGRMEQLGQLTATVAHELRNPLGAVRTSTYLLERKLAGKELNVETQLQRINNGITRCDSIITQLLDYSRGRQIEAQLHDLDTWLGSVIDEEAKRLPGAISLTFVPGLKETGVPFDEPRLHRAIINLLSNAAEALVGNAKESTAREDSNPRITVSTSCDGEFACISVVDNGPGMSAAILDRIREPLFTTKSFGTGLGIPAIEQIAIQHGGALEIQSREGEGAKFVIRLPLTLAESVAA